MDTHTYTHICTKTFKPYNSKEIHMESLALSAVELVNVSEICRKEDDSWESEDCEDLQASSSHHKCSPLLCLHPTSHIFPRRLIPEIVTFDSLWTLFGVKKGKTAC